MKTLANSPLAFINIKDVEKIRARIAQRSSSMNSSSALNILLNTSSKIYIDVVAGVFCQHSIDHNSEEFIEVVYEKVLDYVIDVELSKISIDLSIYCPDKDTLLYIKSDSKVEIIEAKGRKVYPLVIEGNRVSFGDKLFYIVTGKNEVRVIKSHTKGVVIFIGDVFSNGVQQEVMVIAEEGKVYELTRCEH